MKKVLTIAGSDCSGGAGIQADLKTMSAHKVYGMSVLTALTAQNTTGVTAVEETSPDFIAAQLDAVFSDIFPDAVKIGMVSNIEIISMIVNKLSERIVKHIVVDPVMIATSGSKLLNDNAIEAIKTQLIPLATIITPNIPEAEVLSGISIQSTEDMLKAAKLIAPNLRGAVLIKGGHLADCADDLLYVDSKPLWIRGTRIENPNTHGTGCTLSSAIACNLALDNSLEQSVTNAKSYINGALSANLNLGKGSGPLNHCWNL